MTDEQILKLAIEKAVKNGWQELELWGEIVDIRVDNTPSNRKRVWIEYEDGDGEMIMLFDIIFSHDFAKAFWGEKFKDLQFAYWDSGKVKESIQLEAWQYHLMQMVLEEEPIKYLEQFLSPKEKIGGEE